MNMDCKEHKLDADIANHTQPHRCLSLAAQQRDRLRSTRAAVFLSFFLHSIPGTSAFLSSLDMERVLIEMRRRLAVLIE